MPADDAPGWFGKLAMLGDFASRRVDAAWALACDNWLSAGLRASQQALGERWMAAYLAAPVWRFAWGPGVVDARWWFGVLMPSCDAVGRYYPLVIAQPRPQPPQDRIGLVHLEAWWTHLARSGLATLADGATLEDFETALAHSPPWPGPMRGSALRPLPTGAPGLAGERWQAAPGASLGDLMAGLAAAGLSQRLAGASAWWSLLAPDVPGCVMLMPGLPPAHAFASMWSRDPG